MPRVELHASTAHRDGDPRRRGWIQIQNLCAGERFWRVVGVGVVMAGLVWLGSHPALANPNRGKERSDDGAQQRAFVPTVQHQRKPSLKQMLAAHPGLVDAGALVAELQIDLRYAGANNFIGRSVYGDLDTCFLQQDAAEMLARAQQLLIRSYPNWRLRVFDCARPRWVQREMWALVVGTPQQSYVANPARGSIHNFGCAVDLTLASDTGAQLDMGTAYDFFGAKARPDREIALLARGQLSAEQVANRLVLRHVMLRAGFRMLPNEWWHFDCASHKQTRKRYQPIP